MNENEITASDISHGRIFVKDTKLGDILFNSSSGCLLQQLDRTGAGSRAHGIAVHFDLRYRVRRSATL